jgi:WS/DGAT/MGAT family acyltransferase
MQQLTGLDAFFLAMEDTNVQGHGGGVAVLGARQDSTPISAAMLRTLIAQRQNAIPLLTYRLREVPWGLDQPYWIQDRAPEMSHHVREWWIGPDAGTAALAEAVAALHVQRLDRDRPLWEVHLIHGLADGRQAVYLKIHHAAVDGVSGNDLLSALLDEDPNVAEVQTIPPTTSGAPARIPSNAELIARAALTAVGHPRRAMQLAAGLVAPLSVAVRSAANLSTVIGKATQIGAPATPFNRALGPTRRLGLRTVDFGQVVAVKREHGVTINDVVLAMSTAALYRWLKKRDAVPDAPLVAAIPMSTRASGEANSIGNRLTMLRAVLPLASADPADRLAQINRTMRNAKDVHAALPTDALSDATRFAMPALAIPALRMSARLRLLERINLFNLIISNVPGPARLLYLAGAPMQAYFPVSQLVDGQGLNITVLSYNSALHIGVLGDEELVPDPDVIAEDMALELAVLLDPATRSIAPPSDRR